MGLSNAGLVGVVWRKWIEGYLRVESSVLDQRKWAGSRSQGWLPRFSLCQLSKSGIRLLISHSIMFFVLTLIRQFLYLWIDSLILKERQGAKGEKVEQKQEASCLTICIRKIMVFLAAPSGCFIFKFFFLLFFNKWCWDNWVFIRGRMNLDPYVRHSIIK